MPFYHLFSVFSLSVCSTFLGGALFLFLPSCLLLGLFLFNLSILFLFTVFLCIFFFSNYSRDYNIRTSFQSYLEYFTVPSGTWKFTPHGSLYPPPFLPWLSNTQSDLDTPNQIGLWLFSFFPNVSPSITFRPILTISVTLPLDLISQVSIWYHFSVKKNFLRQFFQSRSPDKKLSQFSFI